jgi:protein-glutamine gamma-glutamyltransferase
MISSNASSHSSRAGSPVPPEAGRRGLALRAVVFLGFALLGGWHVSRLQSPAIGSSELLVPLVLALVVAASALSGLRVLAATSVLWIVAAAALAGRTTPSRADPLAPFSTALEQLREGVDRFAGVILPFDPVAEPGLHRLVLAGSAVWLLALALVWVVAARPLPTIVLGALPVALVSTEFPLPRPGLRIALLVALVVWTLGLERRVGSRPIIAFGTPLVLLALVGASLPGLARASFLDWHAWGRGANGGGAATDVRYAWDQSYDGLHYTGEPVVVLRVRSPRPSYWRVTSLDSFDGLRFEEHAPAARSAPAGSRAMVEPRPSGRASGVRVEVAALDEPYLVGAGNPVSFEVPAGTGGGTIDGNGVLRLLRPPSHGTSYAVSAVIADPTRAQLRRATPTPSEPDFDGLDAAPFAGAPRLPPFGDPRLARAAEASVASRPAWRAAYAWGVRATAGAQTPYDVALMLEKKLRATHPYDGSSTLQANDPDALARWITSDAAGYCQMYSASMTELLRLLGVRARIAEGFVTGRYDPGSKTYVVDDRDAHAWVEAWLPGTGFVPFDPTPGRSLPTQASSSSGFGTGPSSSGGPAKTYADPATGARPTPAGTSASSVGRRASEIAGGDWLRRGMAIAIVLALLAAALALARLRRAGPRARGPRAEVGASRAVLVARARRRGLSLPPGVTNGELAAALGADLEIDGRAWASAADRAAYAPADEAERVLPALRAETRRLRRAIRASRRVTLPV